MTRWASSAGGSAADLRHFVGNVATWAGPHRSQAESCRPLNLPRKLLEAPRSPARPSRSISPFFFRCSHPRRRFIGDGGEFARSGCRSRAPGWLRRLSRASNFLKVRSSRRGRVSRRLHLRAGRPGMRGDLLGSSSTRRPTRRCSCLPCAIASSSAARTCACKINQQSARGRGHVGDRTHPRSTTIFLVVARRQRRGQRGNFLRRHQAVNIEHVRLGDFSTAERNHLVQDRLRGRAYRRRPGARSQASASSVIFDLLGFRQFSSAARQSACQAGIGPQVEALAARHDRREHFLQFRRGKDKFHVLGGSSSVLSSALNACDVSMCTSSMM